MKKIIKQIFINYFSDSTKRYYYKSLSKFNWQNFEKHNFEPELLVTEELLKQNNKAVFFDVGSNKGEYTYIAEKFLLKENIHAFEPNPNLYFKLKHIFKKSKINNFALSNINGEADLKVPFLNNIEDDSLGTLNINAKEKNETHAKFFKIKTQTLDRYCFNQNVHRIDCIKIDVEGLELLVLEGAKQSIKVHQPILIIEIEKRHHENRSVLDISEFIIENYSSSRKYIVYYFDRKERKLIQLIKEPNQKLEDHGSEKYENNFVFIPEEHAFYMQVENIKLL
jgi:FkbM family methyltransferase